MLLGVDQADDLRVEPLGGGQRVAAAVMALGVLALVIATLASTDFEATGVVGDVQQGVPDIDELGEALFTRYLYAFEITSVLLVIAIVGAVVLARRTRRVDEIVDPGQAERQAEVTPAWYLLLGAALFSIGRFGLLIRRNPLVMFMCVELMLNAVTLTFVTFSRMLADTGGYSIVVFVLVVAAAEVVVGLAIIVALLRKRPGATADDVALLEG